MMRRASAQRGNIFALLFASTALIGVLGVSAMHTLSGPVTTLQRVTQKNIAQNNMLLSALVLVNAGAAAGDLDTDGIVEPPAQRAAGGAPAPIGGGLLPSTLGLTLSDPWGNQYGYCAYDHGTTNASANRLTGDNTATATTQTVLAVVSAGADKQFQTTCAAYAGGPVSVAKSGGSDDLIYKYSYAEASAVGGGLWTLNASDTNKAELKDGGGAVKVAVNRSGGIVEAVAVSASTVSAPASASDTLSIGGGLLLDTASGSATVCGAVQAGALRLDAPKTGLEICGGSVWSALRAVPVNTGSDKQLFFNDAGTYAAASGLEWTKATSRLAVGGVAPESRLHVNGAVQVADDAAPCVAAKYGAIRFNADALNVCNTTGWAAIGGGSAPFKGAFASLSANTAIANSTQVVIPSFQSEDYDTDDLHAVNAAGFVIPAALNGRWFQLQAGIRFTSNANGSRQILFIKNGGNFPQHTQTVVAAVSNSNAIFSIISPPFQAATGDTFTVQVAQTSGVSLNAEAGSTWFSIRVLD